MSKKADSDILANLHKTVAENILKNLKQANTADSLLEKYSGELPEDVSEFLEDASEVSPAMLTVATKFLKDNNITVDIDDSDALTETEKLLAEKRRRKSIGEVNTLN